MQSRTVRKARPSSSVALTCVSWFDGGASADGRSGPESSQRCIRTTTHIHGRFWWCTFKLPCAVNLPCAVKLAVMLMQGLPGLLGLRVSCTGQPSLPPDDAPARRQASRIHSADLIFRPAWLIVITVIHLVPVHPGVGRKRVDWETMGHPIDP